MRKTSTVHNAQRHSFASGPVCAGLTCVPLGGLKKTPCQAICCLFLCAAFSFERPAPTRGLFPKRLFPTTENDPIVRLSQVLSARRSSSFFWPYFLLKTPRIQWFVHVPSRNWNSRPACGTAFSSVLFFHECGRRVGGVPRSSLKGRKRDVMRGKRTQAKQKQAKTPQPQTRNRNQKPQFPLV